MKCEGRGSVPEYQRATAGGCWEGGNVRVDCPECEGTGEIEVEEGSIFSDVLEINDLANRILLAGKTKGK